jgi:WD40 repeat protein
LWDAATQRESVLGGNGAPIRAIALSQGGSTLATAQGNGTVRLWNVVTRRAATLPVQWEGVTDLALSPDGGVLAARAFRAVRLWTTATRRESTLLQSPESFTGIAFSPDGRTLTTGSSWTSAAKLWNVATGELIGLLEDSSRGSRDVAFSPDGAMLAAAYGDGKVRLWRAATPEEVKTR